jgi:hypothetical protein
MSNEHQDDDAFEEKTQVTGGLRTLDDFVLFKKLERDGKLDEAQFKFQLNAERARSEVAAWDQRLRDPELAAAFAKKMRS